MAAWLGLGSPSLMAAEHVLQTDATGALHSEAIGLRLPFGVGLDQVRFEVGFGTRESAEATGFLDAATLSLQPVADVRGAMLLGLDRFGPLWAPPNPSGLDVADAGLRYQSIPWTATLPADWPWTASFAVTLSVPVSWQDCGVLLNFDLFDNLNGSASVAYVTALEVTPKSAYFLLESASSPNGPYAVEMGVRRDDATGRFELPAGGWARFFRLRSDSDVILRMATPSADEWRMDYAFPEPEPLLESAQRAEGPYRAVTNAVLDLPSRRFSIPHNVVGAPTDRFFRIRGRVRMAITRLERADDAWRLHFEYRPRVFELESSAQPCGPFALEPTARIDAARQTIRVPRNQWVRFFRVARSADEPAVRLGTVQLNSGTWQVPFQKLDVEVLP